MLYSLAGYTLKILKKDRLSLWLSYSSLELAEDRCCPLFKSANLDLVYIIIQ
jgi:hypothetical protein